MKVPDKIYLFETPISETLDDRWLTERSGDGDIEFIRKDALLDWIKTKLSYEQGYADGEAECGYKDALKDVENYLNANK